MQEFNKKSNSLYTILRSSRIAGSQRAPFLRRFLLRLNFNSFFEVKFMQDGGNFVLKSVHVENIVIICFDLCWQTTARGVLNVVRPRPTFASGMI